MKKGASHSLLERVVGDGANSVGGCNLAAAADACIAIERTCCGCWRMRAARTFECSEVLRGVMIARL